jgi:hypothetical protein
MVFLPFWCPQGGLDVVARGASRCRRRSNCAALIVPSQYRTTLGHPRLVALCAAALPSVIGGPSEALMAARF